MKKKIKRTDGGFDWGSLPKAELKLIYKIAARACKDDKRLDFVSLAMDLQVCHAKHFRLRLKEMLATKDNFSFSHDIYMIVGSINRKTFGWDDIGVPRFAAGQEHRCR